MYFHVLRIKPQLKAFNGGGRVNALNIFQERSGADKKDSILKEQVWDVFGIVVLLK